MRICSTGVHTRPEHKEADVGVGVREAVNVYVLDGVPDPVGVLEGVIVGEGVKHWPSGKIHCVPTTDPP
jgi:hypothetical protein